MSDNNSANINAKLVDQLVLDIKSLVLLNPSEDSLKKLVDDRIASSHDDHILRFLSLIQPKKHVNVRGSVLAAMSEMILAAFFVVVGLAILAPSITGLTSPAQLLNYFSQIASSWSAQSLASNPVVPIVEFVFALVLVLGGFYNLRMAATSLQAIKSINKNSRN
ncbi:MAG: hypothetical protein ACYC7D_04335 [Nitrososphaerales archaeon]